MQGIGNRDQSLSHVACEPGSAITNLHVQSGMLQSKGRLYSVTASTQVIHLLLSQSTWLKGEIRKC